jgi:hypothetical protein
MNIENQKMKFVFMDESGSKESDKFFACGFLEIENPQEFSLNIRRVYDQIFNLSIRNRQERIKKLVIENATEQIASLAKSFNQFELKHYFISNENNVLYSDFIKALFKRTKFRYTAIVFDRQDSAYIRDDNPHALHLKALKMYSNYVAPKDQMYIFVPDSFDDCFVWNVKEGNLPIGILPLDSHGALYLQVVDVLTGLVLQALRSTNGTEGFKADISRIPVIKTLEEKLGRKIDGKFTVTVNGNYFNVWPVSFTNKKSEGMDKKPNPRFQHPNSSI